MHSNKRLKAKSTSLGPIQIASGLSAIVFFLGIFVFFSKQVWSLRGNEIGDFFAGFSGALSFIWIIATILLQKEELELQRKEITELARESSVQSRSLLSAARSEFKNRWNLWAQEFLARHGLDCYECSQFSALALFDTKDVKAAVISSITERYTLSQPFVYDSCSIEHAYCCNPSFHDNTVSGTVNADFRSADGRASWFATVGFSASLQEIAASACIESRFGSSAELRGIIDEAIKIEAEQIVKYFVFSGDENSVVRLGADFTLRCAIHEYLHELKANKQA